ncbi:MAG: amidohydrolase family protein [Acidimicrobiia bacterium]|nr:amidohydrolase family protein [Acidimicrobiia bacterium]
MVDCDIHPITRTPKDLHPYLPTRWRRHLETYGSFQRNPFFANTAYPRYAPALSRRDAWPPGGGTPGSDLDFMREQHLEPNNVLVGLLQVLAPSGIAQRNVDFGAAMCRAVNEWQLVSWTTPEPRLRACLTIPQEDPAQAVAEIEHWAGDPAFAQIAMAPRAFNPLGQRRYWPIYEAAVAHGLPIGLHGSGYGGYPDTGSGNPSYYAEDHHSNAMSMQALVTSLMFEGVFERFPDLKVVLIEGGFAWAPSLAWRLDKLWARMADEVPHVPEPPSAYLRRNLWITSQPMEEPQKPRHLRDVIGWMGEDRLLFSTDYPHWDYDDPTQVFKVGFDDELLDKLFLGNACAVYGFTLPEPAASGSPRAS